MKRSKSLVVLTLLALVVASFLFWNGARPVSGPFNNILLDGWIFAPDQSLAGQRTWNTTGTLDTLLISGVDTTCVVFLTAKTATGTLRYDVATAGDTVFVTSSGSETGGTDKYNYFILRSVYGARD